MVRVLPSCFRWEGKDGYDREGLQGDRGGGPPPRPPPHPGKGFDLDGKDGKGFMDGKAKPRNPRHLDTIEGGRVHQAL